MNKFGIVCAVMGILGLFSNTSVAQDLGCSDEVELDGGIVKVQSTADGDDTDNIQCALDAAVTGGYKDVYLTSDAYSIGGVTANDYEGRLRGRSFDLTTINVIDNSLDCTTGAALRFIVGDAVVTRMKLKINEPCSTPGGSASVIGFYSNPEDCAGDRVVFGVVDRVIIEGGGASALDTTTGITMDAAPACFPESIEEALPEANKALGSLIVNRNQIRDLDIGILSSISANGQVDITFNNPMEGLGVPIALVDASQATNIYRNEIYYNDVEYPAGSVEDFGTTGILVGSTAASPAINKTSFSKNKFIDGGMNNEGYAVLSAQLDKSIVHEMIITSNTFTGSGTNSAGAGLAVLDTSNGVISANTFTGSASTWVLLDSGDELQGGLDATVSGWAILANSFGSSTAPADITLGAKTEDNVVGRSQGQPVVADAGSNDVLESSASSRVYLRNSPIRVDSDSLYKGQIETILGRSAPLLKLER
ncbi:hypothetical protein N9M65_00860 [Luminiphilus sp.]|nr:hypothetical protein [Luminiphilus sp.]